MGFSTSELDERALHRRAVEAVIWGIPAVNFDLMRQAAARIKTASNQIVYWSRLLDWKGSTIDKKNPEKPRMCSSIRSTAAKRACFHNWLLRK